VELRLEAHANESWYVGLGNNPILNTDVLGDIIKSTQEGYDIDNEGRTATLGDKQPIGYDSESGKWTFNDNFDLSIFNDKQLELINAYKTVIKSDIVTTVDVVDFEEEYLADNMLKSLQGRGGYGQCIRHKDDQGNYIAFNVKVARNPQIICSNGGSYVWYKPAEKYERGITSIHEIGGHARLFLTSPELTVNNHNKLVEDFETSVRSIFKTGEVYSGFEESWFGFWNIFD
jgi:hypothetical protein